jgi:hypothetical protein
MDTTERDDTTCQGEDRRARKTIRLDEAAERALVALNKRRKARRYRDDAGVTRKRER